MIYPSEGRVEAMDALSEWIGGEVKMCRHEGGEKKYSVRRLAIAGPFSGLEFGPTHPASDFGVKINGSTHPVETIVSIDHLEFFTRIELPTTQLFVCCSSAVFDVGAEARRNLNAAARFSSLVPLIFFLGHCQAASWGTPIGTASIVIGTNLEFVVSETYSARTISDRGTEVRLFSPLTSLLAQCSWDPAHFSKYEPLADDSRFGGYRGYVLGPAGQRGSIFSGFRFTHSNRAENRNVFGNRAAVASLSFALPHEGGDPSASLAHARQ